ncbi:hypothetical protein, partial [Klebsiella aerogenes]|uniref:hypothetical protein n=1 Tax=Klebsiella aerogenes TaxID=548 RepID=UPI001CC76A42
IKVGDTLVTSIQDVINAFDLLCTSNATSVILLFSHPEVRPNLSQDGLPIVSSAPFSQLTHDQLNNRWEFSTVAEHLRTCKPASKYVN